MSGYRVEPGIDDVAAPPGHDAGRSGGTAALLVTLFFIGINLRPAVSVVAPVLDQVRQAAGLSLSGAGALTTLPVLCFGLAAPLAPLLLRRIAIERLVPLCLASLALGIMLRGAFGIGGLFAGTAAIGIAIGIVMTVLPGFIKRSLPQQASLTTGLYTTALNLGGSFASGVAVPIERAGGWRLALACWAVPAALAAAFTLALWRRQRQAQAQARSGGIGIGMLCRSALAWQVSAYMGLQSALAYCVFAWLPLMLVDRGIDALQAGFMLSLSIAGQLLTSLTGPWIATRGRDQRRAIMALLMLVILGFGGCLYGPRHLVWLSALLLGLGQGGTFSIANMLIVLRAPDAQAAAALSGMAQGIGYVLAALAPVGAGMLYAGTHGWDAVAAAFLVVALAAGAAALGAGRRLQVGARPAAVRN
jgi:CP family cyanate transporter-like MFS transporter